MNWIIWREYRLNRLILITGVFLLLLPYLVALIALLWPKAPALTAPHVTKLFVGAAFYSLALSQVAVALLGGNAIAGERADRSAEFIAYLPLPRKRLLGAKLSLALCVVTFIWVTKKKGDNHLSFYPLGKVLLGAFPVGSDSRYKYTASSRRLEIHSKIISVKDQGYNE